MYRSSGGDKGVVGVGRWGGGVVIDLQTGGILREDGNSGLVYMTNFSPG